MEERFIKLYSLEKNLYAENSPVILAAGQLSKDTVANKVLIQLKFKNITDKTIKALRIAINTFDTVGDSLGEASKYEYLDLTAGRDAEFGQKTPIYLKNHATRSFSIDINEVIFDDNSIWTPEAEWKTLPEPEYLIDSFDNDKELLKQFRIRFGAKCETELAEDRDIWICPCGAVNKTDEEKCHKCQLELEALKTLDLEELNTQKEERLEQERITREKNLALAKAQARKTAKIAAIVTPIVIIIIIAISAISSYNEKLERYNSTIELFASTSSSDLEEALAVFEELGSFKESENYVLETKYKLALISYSSLDFEEAKTLFEALGDFKDSKELFKECEFRYNLDEILTGDTYNAYEKSFDRFSDAAKLIKDYKGKKSDEIKKLQKDCETVLKYKGIWVSTGGNLSKLDLCGTYSTTYELAFWPSYSSYSGVELQILPVSSKNSSTDFSYYNSYTVDLEISDKKNYTFEYEYSSSYYSTYKSNYYLSAVKDGKFTLSHQTTSGTAKLTFKKSK